MIEIDQEADKRDVPRERAICFFDGTDGYNLYVDGDCLEMDLKDSGCLDSFMYLSEDIAPPAMGLWVWEGYVTTSGYQTEDGWDCEPTYHTVEWRDLTALEWNHLMMHRNPLKCL